jgi:hypothetical protein
VPKPAKIGEASPLAIREVRREDKRVLVDVVAQDDQNAAGKAVELFVEGPTQDWALPVPKLIKREPGGVLHFAFDLDGLPPGATVEGAVLKLTVAGPGAAYEFTTTLR